MEGTFHSNSQTDLEMYTHVHPQCMATEKLIHASFEETENLEAALGVISSHSPDADFVSLHLRDRLGSNYTV